MIYAWVVVLGKGDVEPAEPALAIRPLHHINDLNDACFTESDIMHYTPWWRYPTQLELHTYLTKMESTALTTILRAELTALCTEITERWFASFATEPKHSPKTERLCALLDRFGNCPDRKTITELVEEITGEPVSTAVRATKRRHELGLMVVPICNMPEGYPAGAPILFYSRDVACADRADGANGKVIEVPLSSNSVRQPTTEEIKNFFDTYPDWHILHTSWLNDGNFLEKIAERRNIKRPKA
jgi:hypothetical protein